MGDFELFLSNLQLLLEQNRSIGNGAALAAGSLRPSGTGDAIDAELGRTARATAVVSLRESPAVEAFRTELVNGLIRVDTANQLLRLVNELITRALV